MSKKTKKSDASSAPTAPENSDAAAAPEASNPKPTLAERVEALERKVHGRSLYDEEAE